MSHKSFVNFVIGCVVDEKFMIFVEGYIEHETFSGVHEKASRG